MKSNAKQIANRGSGSRMTTRATKQERRMTMKRYLSNGALVMLVLSFFILSSCGVDGGDGDMASAPEDDTPVLASVMYADTTPPAVIETSPQNDDQDVALGAMVKILFSEEVDVATITTESCYLLQGATVVPLSLIHEAAILIMVPSDALDYNIDYTAVITTEVKDLAGNPMNENSSLVFTTIQAPDGNSEPR